MLFGSVHLLPRGIDWRPPALSEALSHATALWFELPIDQATDQTAARLTASRGRLPLGDTLWNHLGAEQRVRIEEVARRYGVDPSVLGPLRPWLAEVTLELAADTHAGALVMEGVESQIQSEAPITVRRGALETVRQQIDFLAGGAAADQIASLDETARELSSAESSYLRTVRLWAAGDLAGLETEDIAPLRKAAPGAYQRLIVDRNRRWSRRIAKLASEPGTTVVIVGAGHLLGSDGVPTRLRAVGLQVDGPDLASETPLKTLQSAH